MKKLTTFCSTLLVIFALASCEKTELPAPKMQDEMQLKKSGGQTGGGKTSSTTTATYGGRATGIDATVWNFQNAMVTSTQNTFADTYMLPASGGSVTKSELTAEMTGVFTADALSASAVGHNNSTVTNATVSTLNVSTGGHTISAGYLQANATAGCGGALTGSSQVTNLVVNGQPITVTGAANQTIYLSNGGMIIINGRSTTKKGSTGLTITALHILIPNVSDIRVASARAEIKC